MGSALSSDSTKAGWIREPGRIPHRRYSEPDKPEAAGRPVTLVFRRRHGKPLAPWVDPAVEIVTYPGPPSRSSSAPPDVGGRSRTRSRRRSLRSKKSAASLKKKRKKVKAKSKPPTETKPKRKKKKAMMRRKKKEPPPRAATSSEAESSSETETESEPEPVVPPEPRYSINNPRLSKVPRGPMPPAAANPWAAFARTGASDPASWTRPRMARGRTAAMQTSALSHASFMNPRMAQSRIIPVPQPTQTVQIVPVVLEERSPPAATQLGDNGLPITGRRRGR